MPKTIAYKPSGKNAFMLFTSDYCWNDVHISMGPKKNKLQAIIILEM